MNTEIALPVNLVDLATKNLQRVTSLHHMTGINIPDLEFDQEKSWEMGKEYMRVTFKGIRFKQFMESRLTEMGVPTKKSKELKDKQKLATQIFNENFAVILIRPEMIHITEQIIEFLKQFGIFKFYEDSVSITPDTYWTLYSEAITKKEANPSMPTRTMVYLHSPAKLLYLHPTLNLEMQTSGVHLSDILCNTFKGKAGQYEKGTIRGEVVHNEAVRLGFHTFDNPVIAAATDPLFAYRHLTNNDKNQGIESSVLRYNAVSVHVPNSQEMVRDLSALLTLDQLTLAQYLLFYHN
jgi:hypothetical protein